MNEPDADRSDLTAPCPACGFYLDTPNHVFGCGNKLGGGGTAATYEGAGERKTPTTTPGGAMYDFATDAEAQIAHNVDGLVKSVHGSQAAFHRCRTAAGQLAGTVYAFVEDPEGVGTDALRTAWQAYMQLDSGNFASDPGSINRAAS